MKKRVRPTVRFGERQYQMIHEMLQERNITFQQYCLELICSDLGVPVEEFEALEAEGQMSFFAENDVNLSGTPGEDD